MKRPSEIRRVPIGAIAPRPLRGSRAVTSRSAERAARLRRRARGQSMLLIALCMLLLVALVALAIDGGGMLGERREAQNSVDGAALAGTRYMLPAYEEMIRLNDYDVDGSQALEDAIRTKIENYAAANGIEANSLVAYFVNDNKQLVTTNIGEDRGKGHCGNGQAAGPCEVGANGLVPWSLGAKGIMVKGTARTDSFFMSIFGWNQVGAAASATAFMGVGAMVDNIKLVPLGLFSNTFPDLSDLEPGQHWPLINSEVGYGSGNSGWVNYNVESSGSAQLLQAWLICGFNPSWNRAQWDANCPSGSNVNGSGPTKHYKNLDSDNPPDGEPDIPLQPEGAPTFIGSLVYGDGKYGWWLQGSSGQVNSNCKDFEKRVQDEDAANNYQGTVVLFPIFDIKREGTGTGTMYHVRLVVAFRIYDHKSPPAPETKDYVSCKPSNPPTATPCPNYPDCLATPTPSANKIQWHIEGDVERIYSTSSHGRHGSLRDTIAHTIFLDN
jgi:Flp pilus assembly protein TadG